MFDSMAFVITKDSSEFPTFCSSHLSILSAFSNDVVEAAWESGLGVHALIWVSFPSLLEQS